jgi:hypothetical protein
MGEDGSKEVGIVGAVFGGAFFGISIWMLTDLGVVAQSFIIDLVFEWV